MPKFIDRSGRTFNRWTLIEYLGNGRYSARCSCGTKREVDGGNVIYGLSKSCGCHKIEVSKKTLALADKRVKEMYPDKDSKIATSDSLRHYVDYDPTTGLFTSRINFSHRKVGAILGRVDENGYIRFKIGKYSYAAHRLAWLYMYDELSDDLDIDHINGDRSDNRILNLRICTALENSQNRSVRASGIIGVSPLGEKYVARISYNYSTYYLGLFDTTDEAFNAYREAKRKLHTFNPEVRNAA